MKEAKNKRRKRLAKPPQTVEASVSQINDKLVCDSNNEESDRQMKSTELRVGNLVSVDGKILPVTQIFEKGLNCGNVGVLYELVKPIPLTEEWLERFGCKKQTSSAKGIGEFDWYELPNGMDLVWVLSSKCWVRIETVESVTIKHVHQLQNLYFALTSEELNQRI